MIKIALVDDHKILAQSLSTYLERIETFSVVGTKYNASDFLELLKITDVDIVLIDIKLPDMDGTDLCLLIKRKYPNIKVIAVTMYDSISYLEEMLKNGANGYVLKEASLSELKNAINTVHSGEIYISQEFAFKKIDLVKKSELSKRQLQIITMLSKGKSNKEIAIKLDLSENTIATHRSNIMKKLQIHNVAELVKYAFQNNLV